MKKAERLYRTSKIVRKRIAFLKRMYSSRKIKGLLYEIPEKRIGQCRNRHPLDCGHANCYFCHFDKIYNVPTIQQRKSDLDFKEYLQ